MQGVGIFGLSTRRIFLTFFAVVCTAILILAWEKMPQVTTLLPRQDLLGVLIPESHVASGAPRIYRDDSPPPDAASVELGDHRVEQLDSIAPTSPTIISPPINGSGNGDPEMSRAEKRECNHAKGKWVPDVGHPLYSGFECKQWLSPMWACRLTERPDFSYEGFRWKPKDCKMPNFEGSDFLGRMRNKTIAFVGDSLGRQQFQSLMCMVSGGKINLDVKDVGREYGLVKAPGAIRPNGWAYRFPSSNTTILYYWSASLCQLVPLNISDPKTPYAMHLDRPAWFLQQYLHRFDVLVLNTGHHWNRGKLNANRWEMYVDGAPLVDKNLAVINSAKNFTIYSVVRWVDSQLVQHPRLRAFFRTISPRHFVNGDWNTGGGCDNLTPLRGGNQVSQDGSDDSSVEGAVKGTRVRVLDITALSQLRNEGHISKYSTKGITGMQDCLHWCLPGIPDTWNEILFAQL